MKYDEIELVNQKMLKYFDLLSKGQIPEENWKDCNDALGLTPLHYALILGNDKIFLKMIRLKFGLFRKKQYQEYAKNCPYDLCVWAEYLNKEYTDDVFLLISHDAQILTAVIAAEKAHLFVQKRAIELNRKLERIQRKRLKIIKQKQNFGLQDEERHLYEILDNRNVLEQAKCGIEYSLNEYEQELERLIVYKRKERRNQANQLRTSHRAFENRIRDIIEHPFIIIKYLSLECKQWCLYHYKFCEISIPLEWKITDQETFESYSKAKNDKVSCKPYGNKWFSPNAYKDRNILRIEFRELVKKFHPDNNDVDTTEIFQDISAERMEILESFI